MLNISPNRSPKMSPRSCAFRQSRRRTDCRHAARTAIERRMTITVVSRALLRIAQNLVSLAALLELLLGRRHRPDCGPGDTASQACDTPSSTPGRRRPARRSELRKNRFWSRLPSHSSLSRTPSLNNPGTIHSPSPDSTAIFTSAGRSSFSRTL